MRQLFVFGNEFLADDAFAREVASDLGDIFDVVHCRSPEQLLDTDSDELNILDVVRGIENPMMITDIDRIRTRSMISLHDFDLGFFLHLMEGMGMRKFVRIFGVPETGNSKEVARVIKGWL